METCQWQRDVTLFVFVSIFCRGQFRYDVRIGWILRLCSVHIKSGQWPWLKEEGKKVADVISVCPLLLTTHCLVHVVAATTQHSTFTRRQTKHTKKLDSLSVLRGKSPEGINVSFAINHGLEIQTRAWWSIPFRLQDDMYGRGKAFHELTFPKIPRVVNVLAAL